MRDRHVAALMRFMNERDFRSRVKVNLDSARVVRRIDDTQARRLALSYCVGLWRAGVNNLLESEARQLPYHVALSIQSPHQFESVSKRAALISDTLVLTDDPGRQPPGSPAWRGEHTADFAPVQVARTRARRFLSCTDPHHQQVLAERAMENMMRMSRGELPLPSGPEVHTDTCRVEETREELVSVNSAHHDIIGRWIAEAKPLTEVGATWYLPRYYMHATRNDRISFDQDGNAYYPTALIDFLTHDGRGVDVSGAHPVKSRILRPVVQLEIPVVEGTNLRDFSRITRDEFDSYASFRDFLRLKLLDIDPALNAVDSEVELAKIGLDISTQVHDMHAQLKRIRSKRSVQVTGAVVGTLSAALVAVYGPALATALTIMGATGGVWSVVNAMSENSSKTLEHDKWYYIWLLSRKAQL
ncbi:hypothetical protein EF914_25050 [Streptomyces sp. WAC05458]|uniref:Uncharacterized protein n=1 Tax=Streptomyces rochei TaxID=1928 RepID=A0AAX3ZXG1_STRRO|nr:MULTISPECIES: hypothetical protein [Streptomyces]RSS17494.1 hypothetical protein EF914_25050 [Streptomyces sp. WAC05458]WMC90963.1 hypothetical protein P7W03_35570 [Streptomyces rochei]